MKRFIATVLGLVGLVVLLLVTGLLPVQWVAQTWSSVSAAPGPAEQRVEAAAPVVTVAKAAPEDFIETVLVTGTLVPREEILVAPEVDGLRVLDLAVDEGDRVKRGDVLATLVQETLDAQLAGNDAALAKSDAAIAQARSQITEVEARVAEAQAQLERAKPLRKSGYLSESTFDQREASARTTAALLVAARDGLKVAEAEKARVAAERREIAFKLGNTQVTAPADGLVSRRTARIGAMASSSGDPMFRIIEKGEIELDAEVPAPDLAKIEPGQPARLTVAGLDQEITGAVRLVSPEVDRATRLGRVRVFLGDNPDLHIGAFARGRIETRTSRGIALPASAVMYGPDGAFVQVVTDGTIARRKVGLGLRSGERIEVTSGLAEGDLVVAKAGTFLRDGDAVRPVIPDSKVSEAQR